MHSMIQKKIWIDLDNSPHVPFFKPIIAELRGKNYSFTITARKCFQVCSIAELMGISCIPIGKHYGKHKIMKVIGTLLRIVKMVPTILREKPDIAVSHGSRSQLILANILRIPTIIIFDYEHAAAVPMFPPTYLVFPEVISPATRKFDKSQLCTYPGIKEDVYVPTFKPDPSIREILGLNDSDIVVAIRPPATEAHYRNPESDILFTATIETLSAMENMKMVILPRNDKQEKELKEEWPELFSKKKIIIPEKVVDGLNLIWHSDFVISGGGTMNREAAALGVPVFSIFRGKTGAVDRYLSENGRLTMLESVEDVKSKLKPLRRNKEESAHFGERKALKKIVSIIEKAAQES